MPEWWTFAMERVVPGLNVGFWATVQLVVPSALLGLLLGIVTGTVRVYAGPFLKRIANGYVAVFRGTPLVVQLFVWYFALPYVSVFGHNLVLSGKQAAILGFTLCSGAYHSEYIRGGLRSIKQGQLKAAQALGMRPIQAVRNVVLPQAVRRALPGCGNEIIYLIKYSSLASIITVNELTGMGRGIAKETWRYTEVFLIVALYYLVLVTLTTWLLSLVEDRLSLPGFEGRRA